MTPETYLDMIAGIACREAPDDVTLQRVVEILREAGYNITRLTRSSSDSVRGFLKPLTDDEIREHLAEHHKFDVTFTPDGADDNHVETLAVMAEDHEHARCIIREIYPGCTVISTRIVEPGSQPVSPLPSWIVTLVKDGDDFSSTFYCQAPSREEAIGHAIRTYPGCEIGDVTRKG